MTGTCSIPREMWFLKNSYILKAYCQRTDNRLLCLGGGLDTQSSENDTQNVKDDTKNGENDTKMTPQLNNETPCS